MIPDNVLLARECGQIVAIVLSPRVFWSGNDHNRNGGRASFEGSFACVSMPFRKEPSMPNQQSILVIADANPDMTRTLDKAKMLAEGLGGRLHVTGFLSEGDPEATYAARLSGTVKHAMGDFDNYEISIKDEDDIAGWVVNECKSGDIDLIIKTGHRSEHVLYSPTDWHLIRDTKTPVLLLDGRSHRELKTILATVDIEEGTLEQRTLDRMVLDYSADLAKRFGSTLHAAVCVKTSQILSDLDLVDIHKREHAHAPEVRKVIESEYRDYGIEGSHWHIHAGAPETILAGIATGIKADLVVVGSVGRKRLQGLLLGNTAEKILKNLHTNVLVLKPD